MKFTLLVLSVLLISSSFSQTDAQVTEISEATCECLKEKDLEGANMNKIQIELGMCMLPAMEESGMEFSASDVSNMEEIGEKVGVKLAFSCPEFMELIGGISEDHPDEFNELMEEHSSQETMFSRGTVLEVESEKFVMLKILNEDGKKEIYYWMEHFEGSELLYRSERLLRKGVKIEYVELEVYSPAIEDYTKIKILKKLKMK